VNNYSASGAASSTESPAGDVDPVSAKPEPTSSAALLQVRPLSV
jgi:hypothetical protein